MTATVIIYSAPGCCLCEQALRELTDLRHHTPFVLEVIDITKDDNLHARYLERIPIISCYGNEVCEFTVDRAKLIEALAEAPR